MKSLNFMPSVTLCKWFCLLSELKEKIRDRGNVDGRKRMNMSKRRTAEVVLPEDPLASQFLNLLNSRLSLPLLFNLGPGPHSDLHDLQDLKGSFLSLIALLSFLTPSSLLNSLPFCNF